MSRRKRTIACGAVPVLVLGGLLSLNHIPGTEISLAVPFAAEGPGPSFNTLGEVDGKQVVEILGEPSDKTSGNLNMTTVSVRTGMTLPQVISRWAAGDSIVPIENILPDGISEDDLNKQNQQAFSESESAATLAAMHYLHRPFEVEIKQVVEDSPAHDVFHPGQRIHAIDGKEVKTPDEVKEIIDQHAPGDTVHVDISEQGERRTIPVQLAENPDDRGKPLLGVMMVAVPSGDLHINYNLKEIGGPSAGMMFSLAVVDKLSPGELNGGKFVAGTGTIDEDGTVGPIGGITHKMRTAEDIGAEVFLTPSDNCQEALSEDHGDMTLLKVDTLQDAIEQMKQYSEGGPVKTCEQK